ncbi:MAG: biopolymer transporter ExbD [Candidatus Omnitrophica bacterium]|nr:biopolymer transporter ExbD [Candidatus Omnitrophota bacterium]
MIKIESRKDYLVALESVAMTDIVMNMFIFFFISFSLIYTFNPTRISKVDVKLPKASTAVALEGAERTVLTITRKGSFFMDDEKVSPGKLKGALASRLKENPSMSLLLKVDSMTKFDNVVKALDVINELNISKVSVAAVKQAEK